MRATYLGKSFKDKFFALVTIIISFQDGIVADVSDDELSCESIIIVRLI